MGASTNHIESRSDSDIRALTPGECNRNAIQKRLFDISRSGACL